MFLIDAIFSGILAGFLLALMALGPSFFTLIKVSIHQNFEKGALFAVGIFWSDVLIVFLVYLGLSQFFETIWFKQVFSLAGGILVLAFGMKSLQHHKNPEAHKINKNLPPIQYIFEGFVLNILNPLTFALWLLVIANVKSLRDFSYYQNLIFYTTVLITILSTDLLKAYLANQKGKALSNKLLNQINQTIGVILIILSFRLMYIFFSISDFV